MIKYKINLIGKVQNNQCVVGRDGREALVHFREGVGAGSDVDGEKTEQDEFRYVRG